MEVGKRAFLDTHRLAHLEQHLGLAASRRLPAPGAGSRRLPSADRRRLGRRAADETRDLRRALHEVPRVVGPSPSRPARSRERTCARRCSSARPSSRPLPRPARGSGRTAPACPARLMRSSSARCTPSRSPSRRAPRTTSSLIRRVFPCPGMRSQQRANSTLSTNRNSAITTTNANTIPVVCSVSLRVGHDTVPLPPTIPARTRRTPCPGSENKPTARRRRARPAPSARAARAAARRSSRSPPAPRAQQERRAMRNLDLVDHGQPCGVSTLLRGNSPTRAGAVAGQEGIEPPTCGFGDRRSAN